MTQDQFKKLCEEIDLLDQFEHGFRAIADQQCQAISFELKPTKDNPETRVAIKPHTDDMMEDAHARELSGEIDHLFGWIRGQAGFTLAEIKKLKQKRLDEFIDQPKPDPSDGRKTTLFGYAVPELLGEHIKDILDERTELQKRNREALTTNESLLQRAENLAVINNDLKKELASFHDIEQREIKALEQVKALGEKCADQMRQLADWEKINTEQEKRLDEAKKKIIAAHQDRALSDENWKVVVHERDVMINELRSGFDGIKHDFLGDDLAKSIDEILKEQDPKHLRYAEKGGSKIAGAKDSAG